MRSDQNTRVSWMPVKPQDCVWKNLHRIIVRTILQERVTIHYNIIIWYTNLFLCLKPWRFPQQKQHWIKNGKNWKRFRRGSWRKSEVKKEVIDEARTKGATVHFAHRWTSVIWRMPNWRQSTKNTKVELCSEAILWKMILGLMQYSLNKGHQHHKWQQQKSWISYPDCQGAQDKQLMHYLLIPRYKGKMLQNYWKFPNWNVQTYGFLYHDTNGPNHGSVWKTQSVPLEQNLYGHPLAGLLWERQFEKILLQHGWEKVSNWECLFVHREKGLFLSVYVDDIKLAGKKQNIDPMWKVLMKEVDLGEPTSCLDHVYLGCTKRECQTSKDIVDNYRNMFESKICDGATEKLLCSEKLGANISSWSYDMERHAKKCVERYCELANKTTQQLFKVATRCLADHQFKEAEMGSVGELSKVCSQIVLKCLFSARIGRLDILWSVIKLARAIT